MSRITKDEVKHVAHLARLAVTDEEATHFASQLDDIISFVEQLSELDTDNVKPTAHVIEMKNELREDTAAPWLSNEEALKNAPDDEDGQVRVPSILE
ncbi:Asp-tRNA(Asn)/Glu-tRNA(Gln) amidotransferase subunit GatC [Aureibacillus halotolerans]|uniref:Aspartyl/glutamyl-tRNA(Asn/Gln) amidotransferase subunit C n=1 Tax=Aureibacillus halotolerans TaxID=1508390 RepID=A0A4R6TXD7_9BACI|nr:Asp-tRNA(Asn)/Glu-tRNA(Gln) amidotransferase subunit GatC [Aureibacillus halotolerans]TDQ34165.1 aspartyl/glutamyl-tRNA(Asn/Gln) amidotransferase subunit C [Aureibacillus halotolerans]